MIVWNFPSLERKKDLKIQLTKLIGFSGEEAAGLLSTTQSAIKLRVHRGYAMLRSILAGSPAPA